MYPTGDGKEEGKMMWRRFRGLVKVIGSLTASLGLHTDRYCAQWSAFGSVCVCGMSGRVVPVCTV